LEDYDISEKLMSRLSKQAEGILVSGAPGSGKSTLASGIANFYNKTGKIVKTFESPRDLQVDPGVTQYTKLDGSFENSADVLLLVRPDYTIFDEVRRREDFRIFSDLRLTGVGMVGVVHANTPLDAIQRFIGKIELGIIPSILDTVVFVKDGEITKVYELEFKVKVPSGMVEQDLARPVIEICDFESGELEYEIYTFGEENVIMPVSKKNQKHGIELLAEKKIIDTIRRFDPNPSVEFLSESSIRVFVSKESIPSIIGRNGNTIKELENELSLHIDVEEASNNHEVNNYALPFDFSESRTALLLDVGREYSGAMGEIFVNNEFLISSKINRKGNIKILKRSSDGKLFSKVVNSKNDIEIFLKTR
jgi:ATPase